MGSLENTQNKIILQLYQIFFLMNEFDLFIKNDNESLAQYIASK